jgi:hypothetical protein
MALCRVARRLHTLFQRTYPLSFGRLGLEFSLLGNVTLILALCESRTCHGIVVLRVVWTGKGVEFAFGGVQTKERTRRNQLSYILRDFLYQTRLPFTTLLGYPTTKAQHTPTTLQRTVSPW